MCQSRCITPCRARIPSPLCSAFSAGLTWQPVPRAQPFGKPCNHVGMKKRTRKSVEAVEATYEAAEVDIDLGDTEDDQPSTTSEDSPTLPPPAQAARLSELSPYDAAVKTMTELRVKAEMLRRIAKKQQERERCADRTFDKKMERLDNGAKRNRRQGSDGDFKAVFRRYEAIIASLQAKQESQFFQLKAAEAETAAAKAEVAVWKLFSAA